MRFERVRRPRGLAADGARRPAPRADDGARPAVRRSRFPLVARGQTLGAVTFAWSRSGRRYEEADIRLADELARRAALAIDNARLFRGRAGGAGERLTFLAEASEALAGSLDYERTLERVAKLAVPHSPTGA